ncbi:VOC family protein [Streptomyces toxytricini]|uniref:VOC family protein n=1 Tax=Streptomyces toxytricini TaxID=67369 RepID=A0ABW8ETE0_STRT5
MEISTREVFGAPCWVSLMARDLQQAQEFYGTVLGWKFRTARLGDTFTVAEADGVPIAGIGAMGGDVFVAPAWTPYFAVEDADVATDRIRERSGTIAVGPVSFANGGRGALAADREGAVFGIWQGGVSADWRVGRGPAPAWLELRTRDAFEAAMFYGEVLEWATGREGCCEVAYEDDQVVLRQTGEPVARLNGGITDATAHVPESRPRWHVYFRVRDLDEAIDSVGAAGGTTLSTIVSGPDARWVTVRDPEGAMLTLTAARAPEG